MNLYPDMAGPIATQEAVLASVGMRPIVSHVVEPVTPDQWAHARDLTFTINKMAHALVAGTLEGPRDDGRPGYGSLLHELARPFDEAQVQGMVGTFPQPLLQASVPFVMLAARAFTALAELLPKSVVTSLAHGVQNVRPSDRNLDKFNQLFDVLDDPLEALRLASHGRLFPTQMTALQTTYPTIVNYMRSAVAKEIAQARGDDPSFHLARAAEIGIEKLLGVDTTPAALRALLRSLPGTAAANAGGPPKAPPGVPEGDRFMTRVQRTDANAP